MDGYVGRSITVTILKGLKGMAKITFTFLLLVLAISPLVFAGSYGHGLYNVGLYEIGQPPAYDAGSSPASSQAVVSNVSDTGNETTGGEIGTSEAADATVEGSETETQPSGETEVTSEETTAAAAAGEEGASGAVPQFELAGVDLGSAVVPIVVLIVIAIVVFFFTRK